MSVAAYTKTASLYHWAVAIPLMGSIGCVLQAQNTPKEQKKDKANLMHLHKSLGLLTGIIVAPRFAYRLFARSKVRYAIVILGCAYLLLLPSLY